MDKTITPLINQSIQYGLAFLVMAITIMGLALAITALWKNQNKREERLQELLKENTTAFQELKSSINVLNNKL